jgi:quercetin dioxygenase-like cupin family protein
MTKEMQHLRQLTERLPPFPETKSVLPGFKQHKMECGTSLSWNLDTTSGEQASCAKWFNSAGTHFPDHTHKCREWLIVLEGSMWLKVGGEEERRLLSGMYATIEPETLHSGHFTEDCWYYAITVPQEPSWPTG